MAQLATMLGPLVARKVLDHTSLAGAFDLELKWLSDQPIAIGAFGSGIVVDPDAPALFTALQEELGLKLESTRGPVEVLVIDHLEPPTPD